MKSKRCSNRIEVKDSEIHSKILETIRTSKSLRQAVFLVKTINRMTPKNSKNLNTIQSSELSPNMQELSNIICNLEMNSVQIETMINHTSKKIEKVKKKLRSMAPSKRICKRCIDRDEDLKDIISQSTRLSKEEIVDRLKNIVEGRKVELSISSEDLSSAEEKDFMFNLMKSSELNSNKERIEYNQIIKVDSNSRILEKISLKQGNQTPVSIFKKQEMKKGSKIIKKLTFADEFNSKKSKSLNKNEPLTIKKSLQSDISVPEEREPKEIKLPLNFFQNSQGSQFESLEKFKERKKWDTSEANLPYASLIRSPIMSESVTPNLGGFSKNHKKKKQRDLDNFFHSTQFDLSPKQEPRNPLAKGLKKGDGQDYYDYT